MTVNFMENYRKKNQEQKLFGSTPAWSAEEESFAIMEAVNASTALSSLVHQAQEEATMFMEANVGVMPEFELFMEAVGGILKKVWDAIVAAFKKVADWIGQVISRITGTTASKIKKLVAKARAMKDEVGNLGTKMKKDTEASVIERNYAKLLRVTTEMFATVKLTGIQLSGETTVDTIFKTTIKNYAEAYDAEGEEAPDKSALEKVITDCKNNKSYDPLNKSQKDALNTSLRTILNQAIEELGEKGVPAIKEDDKDPKGTFLKNITKGEFEPKTKKGNEILTWAKGVLEGKDGLLTYIIEDFANGVGKLIENLNKGKKFFTDIADEYKKLSGDVGKAVNKYKDIDTKDDKGKEARKKSAGDAANLVSDIGLLSGWYTGLSIQYYAVTDAAISRAIAEANSVLDLALKLAGKATKDEDEKDSSTGSTGSSSGGSTEPVMNAGSGGTE